MLIILDHDETYTACPEFWDDVIELAKCKGHTIVCCTFRLDDGYNNDVEENMGAHGVEIIYSAHHKDKFSAVYAAGYNPENAIWIDDCPQFIVMK